MLPVLISLHAYMRHNTNTIKILIFLKNCFSSSFWKLQPSSFQHQIIDIQLLHRLYSGCLKYWVMQGIVSIQGHIDDYDKISTGMPYIIRTPHFVYFLEEFFLSVMKFKLKSHWGYLNYILSGRLYGLDFNL